MQGLNTYQLVMLMLQPAKVQHINLIVENCLPARVPFLLSNKYVARYQVVIKELLKGSFVYHSNQTANCPIYVGNTITITL